MDPKWLESVYSDGGPCFVSSPSPRLGETVELRLRMYADAPVRHVLLRTVPNGMGRFTEMERCREKNGLAWYRASILMNEPRVNYQFHLVCDDAIYYYTQEGVREILPDMAHDFVLLADYQPPAWVKSAVFYQIFPERFRNGDPSNDVAPGEYRLNGHPTLRRSPPALSGGLLPGLLRGRPGGRPAKAALPQVPGGHGPLPEPHLHSPLRP